MNKIIENVEYVCEKNKDLQHVAIIGLQKDGQARVHFSNGALGGLQAQAYQSIVDSMIKARDEALKKEAT